PPSVVRSTVPPWPLVHTTSLLTTDSPRNCAVVPVSFNSQRRSTLDAAVAVGATSTVVAATPASTAARRVFMVLTPSSDGPDVTASERPSRTRARRPDLKVWSTAWPGRTHAL